MDQRAIGVFDSGMGGLTALRELRRLRGRLPGARIVLADCGLTRDARALAAYLADRDPGVALTDGAVIRLDENEHTKEEEHGRAGHL